MAPLSSRSKRVLSPAPISTTVPSGWRLRKSLTGTSKMAVRRVAAAIRHFWLNLWKSQSMDSTISTALRSFRTGRFLRESTARA